MNSDCYQLVAVVSVQGVTVHIIIYIIIQDKVLRPNNKVLVVMVLNVVLISQLSSVQLAMHCTYCDTYCDTHCDTYYISTV